MRDHFMENIAYAPRKYRCCECDKMFDGNFYKPRRVCYDCERKKKEDQTAELSIEERLRRIEKKLGLL